MLVCVGGTNFAAFRHPKLCEGRRSPPPPCGCDADTSALSLGVLSALYRRCSSVAWRLWRAAWTGCSVAGVGREEGRGPSHARIMRRPLGSISALYLSALSLSLFAGCPSPAFDWMEREASAVLRSGRLDDPARLHLAVCAHAVARLL